MQFNVYDVFHSQCFHQHVSSAIAAIFRVMLLLRVYKRTNVVSCVAITPYQLNIIIISVKIV